MQQELSGLTVPQEWYDEKCKEVLELLERLEKLEAEVEELRGRNEFLEWNIDW